MVAGVQVEREVVTHKDGPAAKELAKMAEHDALILDSKIIFQ